MKPLFELFSWLAIILFLGIGSFFINILLHELGHAIPILYWSKKRVSIYIGSFGDPTKSFQLRVGRLDLYLKHNPFLWKRGLCKGEERLPVKKMITYLATGPFASLLVTGACLLLLLTTQLNESQKIVLVTLMGVGGSCFLGSAFPTTKFLPTYSGSVARNDMTQILRLWKMRTVSEVYWEASDRYNAKEYSQASRLLETAIGEGEQNVELLRLAVAAQMQAGEYLRAEVIIGQIRNLYGFKLVDEINDGCLKIMAGRYREAIIIHTELLRLHHNNWLLLNNMGYALTAAGEPEKAMAYLDRGLMLAPKFKHLLVNRGLARMRLGQWEEGKGDTERALQIDNSLAEGYRNLGLYALEKNRNGEAREYFLKARALDARVEFTDTPLAEAERRVQSNPI